MDENNCKTPTGEEQLELMLAGLGKRSLTLNESITHTELTDLLLDAYPKLGTISGGWMLHKSTGGGGQRKLLVLPPDSEGYNGQQIKTASGNGKYTLFIAPLQEQIDRTPLPPDSREFCNMPKSPCANCGVLIPLQALPSHIESCKDSIDLCSSSEESYDHDLSSEKTAECPVCRKDFNINVIEAHASDCGLRRAAHEGNRKTSALSLNSFQSLEEILEWVTLQVDDGGTFSIIVSRDDLYMRAMMQWQRQKRSSPKHRLRVSFFGEDGIDTGALSKEFFTEMIAEIENKLFVGGADKKGKNPLYCLSSLDQSHFRTAGEMMVASVAQGGPPPNFMREWCYKYLTTQTDSDSMHVSVSDVTDPELVQLITEVNSATDDSIHTLIDSIVNCGYTGKISCVNKDAIVRAIVLHATTRVVPMLDQLRKGMELYNMKKVLQTHADLCQPLFVPTEDDEVDAAFLLEICRPVYSDQGSIRYSREVTVMNNLQDFLQQIEDCDDGQLTVPKVMQWLTGQAHKPVLPSEKRDFDVSIQFKHDCDGHSICFPTVSACSRTVTLPVLHMSTIQQFRNIMEMALTHGGSFDRA